MAANNKKHELIAVTHEMLKTISPEDIKIRDIAAAANCTSAVIYRHFENLDHLILMASIKFMEKYVIELNEITNQNSIDPLIMELTMWRAFCQNVFPNIEVFDLLFWGKYKKNLGESIFEYYQMFPEGWKHLNSLYTSVFFNSDLKERNTMILNCAAVAGYFTTEDAKLLANLQCDFFHGMMIDYKDTYRQPGVPEKATEIFMSTIESLQNHYRIDLKETKKA